MTNRLFIPILGLILALVIGLLPFPALAQQSNPCAGEDSIYRIFCSLAWEFQWLPKFMSLLCYIGGVALVFMALLNLRQYGDDPSSIPLRSILMKFALAALLLSLPLTMNVLVGSITGEERTINSQSEALNRPTLSRGASIPRPTN